MAESKAAMTVRAAGTTFENRQERLQFLQQFRKEDLTVTQEREPDNRYDSSAIQVVVHIKPDIRKVFKSGATDSVMDLYSRYLKK